MIKAPFVIEPDRTPAEALELMRDCDVRHLPVVESGKLVGVLSDRDLREAVALPLASTLTVRDVMKAPVFSVSRHALLRDVVEVMMNRKLGSVVVTNGNKDVVGIFTTTDALGILLDRLEGDVRSIEDSFEPWSKFIDDEEGQSWEL